VGELPHPRVRGSRDVVAAVASNHQLVVVEGAAGAGKTTTLAAARAAVERAGGRLMVVTPTLKAANVAARELDARTSSAAWLAYQHGYRWHDTGGWTRLNPGTADPDTGAVFRGPSDEAMLRGGDLLLVDLCRCRDYAERRGESRAVA
jgi:energy-coupling factor transporter ATP-binding protein EcfA2